METFLAGVEPGQPFLLCVGEKRARSKDFTSLLTTKPFRARHKRHLELSMNYLRFTS